MTQEFTLSQPRYQPPNLLTLFGDVRNVRLAKSRKVWMYSSSKFRQHSLPRWLMVSAVLLTTTVLASVQLTSSAGPEKASLSDASGAYESLVSEDTDEISADEIQPQSRKLVATLEREGQAVLIYRGHDEDGDRRSHFVILDQDARGEWEPQVGKDIPVSDDEVSAVTLPLSSDGYVLVWDHLDKGYELTGPGVPDDLTTKFGAAVVSERVGRDEIGQQKR